MSDFTLGVDLGGTNVRVAAVDNDGNVRTDQRAPTPEDFDAIVTTIAELVRAATAEAPDPPALGVGTAGMIDYDGVVHYAPNLPTLIERPMRAAVQAATGLPTVVDNDANAAAWGEVLHGAAQGTSQALVITLGTGIGGAIVDAGRVVRGAHGFAAEVGHFQVTDDGTPCACGETGHWEALASGNALGRMGRERAAAGALAAATEQAGGDPAAIKGVHVGDAAQAGDAEALAVLDEWARWVAIGLAGLTNILDPERIVVSGGLVELGEVLFGPLRRHFTGRIEGPDHRPPVEIVPAALGEQAGVIGAAALARELR
ncbi:MAG: ROK family protein [Acidimicrobiia bacterium]